MLILLNLQFKQKYLKKYILFSMDKHWIIFYGSKIGKSFNSRENAIVVKCY